MKQNIKKVLLAVLSGLFIALGGNVYSMPRKMVQIKRVMPMDRAHKMSKMIDKAPETLEEAASRLDAITRDLKCPELKKAILDIKKTATDFDKAFKAKKMTKAQVAETFTIMDEALAKVMSQDLKKGGVGCGCQRKNSSCKDCVKIIEDVRRCVRCCCQRISDMLEDVEEHLDSIDERLARIEALLIA